MEGRPLTCGHVAPQVNGCIVVTMVVFFEKEAKSLSPAAGVKLVNAAPVSYCQVPELLRTATTCEFVLAVV